MSVVQGGLIPIHDIQPTPPKRLLSQYNRLSKTSQGALPAISHSKSLSLLADSRPQPSHPPQSWPTTPPSVRVPVVLPLAAGTLVTWNRFDGSNAVSGARPIKEGHMYLLPYRRRTGIMIQMSQCDRGRSKWDDGIHTRPDRPYHPSPKVVTVSQPL